MSAEECVVCGGMRWVECMCRHCGHRAKRIPVMPEESKDTVRRLRFIVDLVREEQDLDWHRADCAVRELPIWNFDCTCGMEEILYPGGRPEGEPEDA